MTNPREIIKKMCRTYLTMTETEAYFVYMQVKDKVPFAREAYECAKNMRKNAKTRKT